MKKILLIISILLFILGCKIPQIVKDNNKEYKIIQWEGGDFIYVNYIYKGGKFDDAVEICKEFGNLVKQRNLGETVLGIFPDAKNWKLGMIVKDKIDIKEINGFKIERSKIDSGKYGDMVLKGYPDRMFNYYSKLKNMLIKDGYKILSPVYEIYTYDTFNNDSIPVEERIGEIRYNIAE